jgi:hypothetical protein
MKISKAEDVKVGDVMVFGSEMTCHERPAGFTGWARTAIPTYRCFADCELQDLIDHGFEVTRKVEPVVFETHVSHTVITPGSAFLSVVYKADLRGFEDKQRVRVTVEPLD